MSTECEAVIVMLADMPEITTAHLVSLVAAFDPANGHEVCRAIAADGTPGLPVLFSRRFFDNLRDLRGDVGARGVVKSAAKYLVDVPTKGQGAVIDLDTPEAWESWLAVRD